MRFDTNQHPFYCGIDLHTRSMDVCIMSQEGARLVHRNRQAAPEPFLQAIAPSRDGLVVAVACLFPWYGLADLCAPAGMPLVLGPALSLKALHGGKAKNDNIDAQKIAPLRRGGLLPTASVYPAERRATRAWLRRRTHLRRKRAALLTHVPKTHAQYHLPEIGKTIAYTAHRAGGAARFDAPAGQKTLEVALALLTYAEQRRSHLALFLLNTAKQHEAQPLSF
jgi:transposase